MAAKQRHKDKLLKYLADWSNPWPNRDTMPGICGLCASTLRHHFSVEDFAEMESLGLEMRLKNAAVPRANAYDALTREAADGNVSAIKELLDRTEGKVIEKREYSGKDGAPIVIMSAIPEPGVKK